jgi:predicted nucleotidyltransferase
MLKEIKTEIGKLEAERKIKIIYAVESGSRAWGFASTDSDWDVRFIYVHQYDWYLSIEEKKDNIEILLPNDIDLGGWELRKALLLFRKSNPPLLEWLRSPIKYKEELALAEDLRVAMNVYFNPKSCMYHYLHMANGNYEAYFKGKTARLKKYFYVLRPILACSWIEKTGEMAPMEFDKLLRQEISDRNLKNEIIKLVTQKKNGEELDIGDRIPIIDEFVEKKLSYLKNYLEDFNFKNTPGYSELNTLFRKTLKEAWD